MRADRGRAERFFKEMTRLLLRLCREAVERLHHTVQLPGSGILDGRLETSRRLSTGGGGSRYRRKGPLAGDGAQPYR